MATGESDRDDRILTRCGVSLSWVYLIATITAFLAISHARNGSPALLPFHVETSRLSPTNCRCSTDLVGCTIMPPKKKAPPEPDPDIDTPCRTRSSTKTSHNDSTSAAHEELPARKNTRGVARLRGNPNTAVGDGPTPVKAKRAGPTKARPPAVTEVTESGADAESQNIGQDSRVLPSKHKKVVLADDLTDAGEHDAGADGETVIDGKEITPQPAKRTKARRAQGSSNTPAKPQPSVEKKDKGKRIATIAPKVATGTHAEQEAAEDPEHGYEADGDDVEGNVDARLAHTISKPTSHVAGARNQGQPSDSRLCPATRDHDADEDADDLQVASDGEGDDGEGGSREGDDGEGDDDMEGIEHTQAMIAGVKADRADEEDLSHLFDKDEASDLEDSKVDAGMPMPIADDKGKALYVSLSPASGSSYSEMKALQCQQRQRGMKKALDTEEEDLEIDEELQDDVSSDMGIPSAPPKRVIRGQRPTGDDDTSGNESDEFGERLNGDWPKTSSPFPRKVKKEAVELGARVIEAAENIAQRYGKSPRDVLVHAGLGFKASRAVNRANMFHSWYSHHHPKLAGMSKSEYNKQGDVAYRQLFEGVTDDDEESRTLLLKPILQWYESSQKGDIGGSRSMKSTMVHMQNAKDQFTTLAAAYRNLEDMEVIGAILYLGLDLAARQVSTLFGGSKAVKDLIDANEVDVREIIDDLTTAIKAMRLEKKGFKFAAHRSKFLQKGSGVDPNPGELIRDRNRRVFTMMMAKALINGIQNFGTMVR
ncbi:hypothetical protein SCP_0606970 [Sparassis crispa]|uniref:Uncharacterized protein n=1 Tax=Sparassis crispa TaxID=139825 RepID=A0A401GR62_9APHY|nr:hypothetical protein SCP_0606970 [Sparassis crispa]GBE84717.1 hypothetical protein SCP_0606970 [Sparassis crispa]